MQGLLAAHKRVSPRTMPPIRQDPGEFMIAHAKSALPASARRRIPGAAETVASTGLHLGYGATFGALYGAMRSSGGSAWTDGPLLGLLTWAAGYLGWLPASELMPPLWKQDASRAALPAVEHALFGVATVAAYQAMHQYFHGNDENGGEDFGRPGNRGGPAMMLRHGVSRVREALHV